MWQVMKKFRSLHDPFLMKDMEKAAEIIMVKIKEGKTIRIIGDYDVDGICSSYILFTGLRELGGRADIVIPHRMKDGYGLNDHLIDRACEGKRYDSDRDRSP